MWFAGPPDSYMGCDAEIVAIGPYSKSIVPALCYPEEQYRAVAEGATVITCVFEAFGSTESEKLARCFGVGRWDLGRHVLDASQADLETLRREFGERDAEDFLTLREAGFQFYYMPNG
jgi:hypothetical protein